MEHIESRKSKLNSHDYEVLLNLECSNKKTLEDVIDSLKACSLGVTVHEIKRVKSGLPHVPSLDRGSKQAIL